MPKTPVDGWLAVQERRRSFITFVVEWIAIFMLAWLFWAFMFWAAPGSMPPRIAALGVSGLYATCMIYGRMLRATGCKRCANPLPFLRREVGRRHLPDQEDCMEVQYGAEEFGQQMVQDYCRVIRTDMVTYRCRSCGQAWDERVQLPTAQYERVRRTRARNRND